MRPHSPPSSETRDVLQRPGDDRFYYAIPDEPVRKQFLELLKSWP